MQNPYSFFCSLLRSIAKISTPIKETVCANSYCKMLSMKIYQCSKEI